ncbi:hypothetical protein MSG28_011450 [Choristoneura fumiferana]|uniref:Uncharacterized protein n=1 Tax=Choristoneura fumiferana TaxID=7141 RepID=A0ACC0JN74_CHOFU|nr:hypothetical protein MSG28_011450 [Choristoneura fumiferana]
MDNNFKVIKGAGGARTEWCWLAMKQGFGDDTFIVLDAVANREREQTDTRTEWLRLINREDLIDSSCFRARVCEAHFSPDCIIMNSSRKLLKRNSIPRLLLPLPNNNSKGIQAVIETADAYVQCDYDLQFQMDAQVQTPLHLSNDTPRKRKLLSEIQRCRKRLKITNNTQSEANTFFKLCDKFLTPTFARVVKQQSKIKTEGPIGTLGGAFRDQYRNPWC